LARLNTADLQANYDAAVRSAQEAESKIAQTRDQGTLNIQQGQSGLASAQSTLAQAQQQLALSQSNMQRDQELYPQGYITKQQLDTDTTQYLTNKQAVASAQASLESARSTVLVNGTASHGLQQENVVSAQAAAASAQAQAKQIAVQIAKAVIVAPVDGIVVNRSINVGQYPGTNPLFTLQDVSTVYATLNASSDQVFLIHPGARARVTLQGLPGDPMPGVVEAVLGQAQPGSTNFIVKVRLPNVHRRLQSGMLAVANVSLPVVEGPMIPTSAFTDASRDTVQTRGADGATRLAPVRDVADDGHYSIVEGLSPQSRVVIPQQ
jgi:multidrug resistance efflux pump